MERISVMSNKVFFKQVGGAHYKKYKIQPSLFINKNKILFAEGNAIKYIFADIKIKVENKIF
jgi:hypothetical protein